MTDDEIDKLFDELRSHLANVGKREAKLVLAALPDVSGLAGARSGRLLLS